MGFCDFADVLLVSSVMQRNDPVECGRAARPKPNCPNVWLEALNP